MRRFSIVVPLLVVMLIGLVAVGRGSLSTLAQEGTPGADAFEVPEGVTFTPLGFGTAQELPTAPADFFLLRFALDPGAGFPIEADDPSVGFVYVESGTITFRIEAPIQVVRAATIAAFAMLGPDESAVPAPEQIAAGTEFTLAAGDSAVVPGNTAGEIRNDGSAPAVALVTLVGPPEDGEAGTPMAGTPAP